MVLVTASLSIGQYTRFFLKYLAKVIVNNYRSYDLKQQLKYELKEYPLYLQEGMVYEKLFKNVLDKLEEDSKDRLKILAECIFDALNK